MKRFALFLFVTLMIPEKADRLELEYTLAITDPASGQVHVEIRVSNVQASTLVFTFDVLDWIADIDWACPADKMSGLMAVDADGSPLTISTAILADSTIGYEVTVGTASVIYLNYDIGFGFLRPGTQELLGGYLGSEFGLAEVPFTFLVPVNWPEVVGLAQRF